MTPILVMVTVPSAAVGKKLGKKLVKERLAACVQVVPGLTSIYRWEGKIETSKEHLLLLKSADELWPSLQAAVRENHPYDCPEIVAVPPGQVSKKYAAWWREALGY
ncbi:divalent cation tolerance protein [Verrucomicrobium sp. GAS474]|uniref:divalent-cation tolerance protein CutA n=1 Tax=Verrucomicrobium sp. GAS474 TaxID=1882831 RepID=UPI00087CE737|nr:divalent-cation tolerance protein CutA [Verrucomicrobium sp. GAS474]SDU09764.1 divalent cation tolerance protein [Verrucomicrobium sp. GAS474]